MIKSCVTALIIKSGVKSPVIKNGVKALIIKGGIKTALIIKRDVKHGANRKKHHAAELNAAKNVALQKCKTLFKTLCIRLSILLCTSKIFDKHKTTSNVGHGICITKFYYWEMRFLVEFDSFKQRAAQAAANIKLAGESL